MRFALAGGDGRSLASVRGAALAVLLLAAAGDGLVAQSAATMAGKEAAKRPESKQDAAAARAEAEASPATVSTAVLAGAAVEAATIAGGAPCPGLGTVALPTFAAGSDTKSDSFDSPQPAPGAADPTRCTVPDAVLRASERVDARIRELLSADASSFGVTFDQYLRAAPAACQRDLVLFRLSVAGQMLGGAP